MTSVITLIRGRGVASLATLEPATQHPYASLITVATETDGAPLFLISTLAWHTRNLDADPRASILFAADASIGDPLNMGRVSAMGVAERTGDPRARSRFLAKHPSAASYADFADFSVWRLRVEKAHFVGGFGRITTLAADDFLLNRDAASAWDEQIDAAIAVANETKAEQLTQLAAAAAGGSEARWTIAACDPDGCDLVSGQDSIRVNFPERLSEPEAVAETLMRLAREDAYFNH